MNETTTTIAISAKAFDAACDPRCSNVPTEENWPTPTFRRAGRGRQAVYDVDLATARLIESHLRMVGEALLYADAEARAEGRACIAAADRLAPRIAEMARNEPSSY